MSETAPVPNARVDELIMAAARANWRKVAMIMFRVIEAGEAQGLAIGDEQIGERVRALAEAGKLDSQGDLRRPRFSEVRLPTGLPPEC